MSSLHNGLGESYPDGCRPHKAFDTVDHGILAENFQALGSHSNCLNWCNSNLYHDKQTIKIKKSECSEIEITSELPKG